MHSKLRPPSGVRWRLTVGASSTWALFERASRPSASPTRRTRSTSNEAPSAAPHGNDAEAGPVYDVPRTPAGPSDVRMAGTPMSGNAAVCQVSAPASSAIFCSRLSEGSFTPGSVAVARRRRGDGRSFRFTPLGATRVSVGGAGSGPFGSSGPEPLAERRAAAYVSPCSGNLLSSGGRTAEAPGCAPRAVDALRHGGRLAVRPPLCFSGSRRSVVGAVSVATAGTIPAVVRSPSSSARSRPVVPDRRRRRCRPSSGRDRRRRGRRRRPVPHTDGFGRPPRSPCRRVASASSRRGPSRSSSTSGVRRPVVETRDANRSEDASSSTVAPAAGAGRAAVADLVGGRAAGGVAGVRAPQRSLRVRHLRRGRLRGRTRGRGDCGGGGRRRRCGRSWRWTSWRWTWRRCSPPASMQWAAPSPWHRPVPATRSPRPPRSRWLRRRSRWRRADASTCRTRCCTPT